ncbi:helix-turn-helix domain-containing protein [Rhizobium jaguaris]|uniref:XRE family transcriptional regulator n=1 Tax=Rhizobium jaguaris TaxID=1312183 RepID=A0A387G9P2_9HYPH|nr:helix-turn-helix transcriptional regulator [Rhizobium jaguaris]AYG64532.1 XRE family transcriptional regulator [Rhizobium jaguaris]
MNGKVTPPIKSERRQKRRLEPTIQSVDLHVGQQIRILRIQMRLSQSDLGKGIGLSYQQIQKYEIGRNRVSASMLYQMAKFFSVPAARFFEGIPEAVTGPSNEAARGVDDHIAYISTTEGRDLIARMLLLSPRVRKRVVSLVGALTQE